MRIKLKKIVDRKRIWNRSGKAVLWLSFLLACFWQARSYSARLLEDAFSTKNDAVSDVSEAELLLHTSVQKLLNQEALSADVEFEAFFFGEKYFGRGRYAEASAPRSSASGRRNPFERTRFLLKATLSSSNVEEAKQKQNNGEENFITIVCDCNSLSWWSYSSIEDEKKLKRINIEELWNRFQRLDPDELEVLKNNGVSDLNCGMNALPGLGGLPGVLKRVDAYYDFTAPVEKIEQESGNVLYKITGKAKDRLWNEAKKSLEVDELEPFLAENIPAYVDVYFGSEQVFPYRIEFYSLNVDGKDALRKNVFCVSYTPNDDPVRPEDFNYDQPQSTFEHMEIPYLEKLIPGVRL